MRDLHHTNRSYKEVFLLIFCLLIGSALPALAATLAGRSAAGQAVLHDGSSVRYYSHDRADEPIELTLRELLIGTLAAYNRSDTPIESLKAQAVALRSRACCLIGCCNSDARSLCDSPSHGLVYADREALAELYGQEEAEARMEAAQSAVDATPDEVLCYEDAYVLALTHDASDGMTREMEGYPYLRSVATPEGEEKAEEREEGSEATEEEGTHGFGLSRAGAAIYAEKGLDYREILAHYFPETELTIL